MAAEGDGLVPSKKPRSSSTCAGCNTELSAQAMRWAITCDSCSKVFCANKCTTVAQRRLKEQGGAWACKACGKNGK
jgi:hypothetical protein